MPSTHDEVSSGMAAPDVLSGAIIVYRLFDLADEIDLTRAEALWAAQPGFAATRGRLATTPAKAVAFGVPPLVLALDAVEIALPSGPVNAGVTIRLFDFGVASLALRVGVNGMGWAEYCRLANALDQEVGPDGNRAVWTGLLARLRKILGPALLRPSEATREEDYMVGLVQGFSAPLSAAELLNRIDLVPLLSGEQRTLSEGARADLLRRQFSYYADDLAVLTWDRAFIYEPRGDSDVMDIIEVANAQFLEMRYYDELLDAELPRMYEAVDSARKARSVFGARRFAALARRFHKLVAEVTELTERLDNALQVTEDVYLARIYMAALDLFRVQPVSDAVNRKLAIVRETYTALYNEAASGQSELMEILIAVLIAVELILAVMRH